MADTGLGLGPGGSGGPSGGSSSAGDIGSGGGSDGGGSDGGPFGGGGSRDILGGSQGAGERGQTIWITRLTLNNLEYKNGDNPLELKFTSPVINWAYSTTSSAIRQIGYEIRIGLHNVGWGTSSYIPDVYRQPFSQNPATFWRLKEKHISVGSLYFGQIRIKDNTGGFSPWTVFSFKINRQPRITSAQILPESPNITDDLIVTYKITESDATVFIKWFRNGQHQSQFDNYDKISKEYLRYKDEWFVELGSMDRMSAGPIYATSSVLVSKLPPVASELEILPKFANDQDILTASYSIEDPNINNVLLNDHSVIKWYVNGFLIENASGFKSVRLATRPGDEVFFTVTPSEGIFEGETVSSPVRSISDADFRIENVRVDGESNNINVSTVNPTIEWNVIEPFRRFSRFASINIGTAPGADNVYQTVLTTYEEKFVIPDNIIKRGVDYYVTISASDSSDRFVNKTTTHFRVSGFYWEETVNNQQGWTIEISLKVEDLGYQYLSIADGKYFAQVRFFEDKVHLLIGDGKIYTYNINLTSLNTIIIVGKENSIKLYKNNQLIIDADGYFITETSGKFLEIGSPGDSESIGYFKKISYTTEGAYWPDSSTEYADINFQPFVSFVGSSISSITEYNGSVIFSVNPVNSGESANLYQINDTASPLMVSTENIDKFDIEINTTSASPDENFICFGHSKGVTLFKNYFIPQYDVNNDFSNGSSAENNWEMVSNVFSNAIRYSPEGLVIDTTFANTNKIDNVEKSILTQNIAGISLSYNYDTQFLYNFYINIDGNYLRILSATLNSPIENAVEIFSISLESSIEEICNNINLIEDNFFKWIIKTSPINDSGKQSGFGLYALDTTLIFPNITLYGDFRITGVYDPNPYSYVSGGKWFYTHRKHGTPWFDKINNQKGWTVDFDLTVDSVEDSDRPLDFDNPNGVGLYLNDGSFYENIYFLPQEIVLSEANHSIIFDTTDFVQYRITGKEDSINIYAKKNTDSIFKLIVESKMTSTASAQGNGSRPSVIQSIDGIIHAVWHDDGRNGKHQIFYAFFDPILEGWSDPELIVYNDFGASRPDICIDNSGTLYVVFESHQTDYTDIAIIVKNDQGWSDSYLIATSVGGSVRPKIAVDYADNVHVVWEDSRLSQTSIFYCRRNAADGQWLSSSFGFNDIQISDVSGGAVRPSITTFGLNVYVSWTSKRADGTSGINVSYYNAGSKIWFSSGQGQFDFSASPNNSKRADFSKIILDKKGRVFVIYQDLVSKNYQIMARRLNSNLTVSSEVMQLTVGEYDSRYPYVGLEESTGDIYIVFEKEQDRFVDPYTPYLAEQEELGKISSIYLSRFNASNQLWESSNQQSTRMGITYGGFDVKIEPSDDRTSRRPVICRNYTGNMHILYESELVAEYGKSLSNHQRFTLIRDAVFDHSFDRSYVLDNFSEMEYNQSDPYLDRDKDVSGNKYRKEIRFGDFSNSLGVKFVVKSIRYYLNDAVDPFEVKLLSSSTMNMPSASVYAVKSNNRGDLYIGSDVGLMFFDSYKNDVFLYDDANTNIAGKLIFDIASDSQGNLYLATNEGVFVSQDHVYFWKITGNNILDYASVIELDNSDRLYIGSKDGLSIVESRNFINTLISNVENYQTERIINITDAIFIDKTNGLPSNSINVVKIDANGIVWIGTDDGLVRYAKGKIFLFTNRHGLASNKILDIAIRNTAIRYIASTAGVDKMIGTNIERLDFGNINAPVASLIERSIAEVDVPNFNDTRSIIWKDPNLLYICSINDIYQIVFTDEQFNTEQTQISKFTSADYALIETSPLRNDDLQSFRLVGINDIILPSNCIFEVFLNGQVIKNGYQFSPIHNLLRFDYPLNKHDVVKVNLRLDIKNISNFEQNQAQKIALGNKSTKIAKVVSFNGSTVVMTNGDVNSLQVNDLTSNLPFDKILLDTHPPVGKIRIGSQVDRTKVRVHIDQIDPYTPFDAVSGIDTLTVSNFTNFTSNGDDPLDDIVFTNSMIHDLGLIFENATREMTFENATGRALGKWDRSDNISNMFAGDSFPAKIYGYNAIDNEWTLRSIVDGDNLDSVVHFIYTFNGILVVGTGSENGVGKIYTSSDGVSFNLIANLSVKHAYCCCVHNNVLYIGGGGNVGKLISFDGRIISVVFSSVSGAIYDIVSVDGVLYAATGEEGRIYRLNPQNLTQQIVHVDSDSGISSIGSGIINEVNFVFAGTSETARIMKQKLPNNAFSHSFKTIPGTVHAIKNIDNQVYAAIGKTLYVFDKVWQAKYTHIEDILDISEGPDGKVWFVSANYVYKIEEVGSVRNVYLKMTDRAGNETNLYIDENSSKLDPNLYDSVNISDLANYINKNRIIEVNDVGDTVFSYQGNDRFYSADRIDEEIGIYFSEIFNGTNRIVSWDRISWDSIVPSNTDLNIYVRTASTRDALLESDFMIAFSNDDSPSDISFLSGQYLQFKVVMTSRIKNLSPSLRRVVVKSIASDSTHFFSTNFVLPSKVKSGILTSHKMVPVAADIVFGINTMNSVDFSDYQIIDENRVFTTDGSQIGNNLRVGVRLITPTKGEFIAEDFGEYGPYATSLMFNSVDWSITNTDAESNSFDFRITFYEDSSHHIVSYTSDTITSTSGFSGNGEVFPNTGFVLNAGETGSFSFTPINDTAISCNKYYFVKIEANKNNNWYTISDSKSFIEACGTTFVDSISFDFQNENDLSYFNFRIRFYTDAGRTNLALTSYSGNDQSDWYLNDQVFPTIGAHLASGKSANITYTPLSSSLIRGSTYYLSIDAFDGSKFNTHSNSFTFKIQSNISEAYCGEYRDVPVLKNLAVMFELENGEFVTLRLED